MTRGANDRGPTTGGIMTWIPRQQSVFDVSESRIEQVKPVPLDRPESHSTLRSPSNSED